MKPHYSVIALLFFSLSALAQKRPLLSKAPDWVTVNQFDYANTKFDSEAEDGYIDLVYEEQVSVEHVADRAAAYGFPGVVVDGTDVLSVYEVIRDAAERARNGEGPTLVEAKVYRFQPHTSDDDDRAYRDPDEVKAWRARRRCCGPGAAGRGRARP